MIGKRNEQWECSEKVVVGSMTVKCGLPPSQHTVTGRTTHRRQPTRKNVAGNIVHYGATHPFRT